MKVRACDFCQSLPTREMGAVAMYRGWGRVAKPRSFASHARGAARARGGRIALHRHNRQTAWAAYFLRRARWHELELRQSGLAHDHAPPKAMPDWEEFMPRPVCFS